MPLPTRIPMTGVTRFNNQRRQRTSLLFLHIDTRVSSVILWVISNRPTSLSKTDFSIFYFLQQSSAYNVAGSASPEREIPPIHIHGVVGQELTLTCSLSTLTGPQNSILQNTSANPCKDDYSRWALCHSTHELVYFSCSLLYPMAMAAADFLQARISRLQKIF